MRITFFQDQKALDQLGSSIIIEELRENPQLKLCAATGSSPIGIYGELTRSAKTEPQLYSKLQVIKLDEWVGLNEKDPNSCEEYLQEHLIIPLGVTNNRFLSFNPCTENPEEECSLIRSKLDEIAPIDLCVLGLGKNGHLGFNEPGRFEPHSHVRELEGVSKAHQMIESSTSKPTHGMTLGIDDILSSKKIIMVVSGSGKEKAKEDLLSGVVFPGCPASILWEHPDVTCLVLNG